LLSRARRNVALQMLFGQMYREHDGGNRFRNPYT
jgi:hypothetical protein